MTAIYGRCSPQGRSVVTKDASRGVGGLERSLRGGELRVTEDGLLLLLAVGVVSPLFGEPTAYVIVRYLTATICLVLVGYHLLVFSVFNPIRYAAVLAALLGMIGIVTFGITQFVTGSKNSYAAGLVPFFFFFLPAITSRDGLAYQFSRLQAWILRCLVISGVVTLATFFFGRDMPIRTGHELSYAFVLLAIYGVIFKKWIYFTIGVCLSFVFITIRPSSTLAGGWVVAILCLYILKFFGSKKLHVATLLSCYLLVASAMMSVFGIGFFDFLMDIEQIIKIDFLGGVSNADFRNAVAIAMREEFYSENIVFGRFFTGNINPFVFHLIPWFGEFAPIHSDFMTVMFQGGLVGFSMFSAVFLLWQHLWRRASAACELKGDVHASRFFDFMAICQVVFMLYMSFNPILQRIEIVAFFYVLALLALFRGYGVLASPPSMLATR